MLLVRTSVLFRKGREVVSRGAASTASYYVRADESNPNEFFFMHMQGDAHERTPRGRIEWRFWHGVGQGHDVGHRILLCGDYLLVLL